MFICVYILHRLNPILGTKLGFFLVSSPILPARASYWSKRNNHLAACSTVLRSVIEENELGGYVTVPCPSKVTQRSSTADWLKF